MARLDGKVAIITGGGSGIGRAGAVLMATEGARIVVADINPTAGERVAESIRSTGGEATFVAFDVRDPASVEAMVDRCVELYGRVDVLFHNADDNAFANAEDRRLTELPEETWDKMIQLVLTGTFLCCKYAGRQMVAQGSGSIILTATTDALIGVAGLDSYTAAKGGVVSVTRSLAAGLAPDGVRVNAIAPGFVSSESQTPWLTGESIERTMKMLHLFPVSTPEQIAPLALYLASDESAVVTGTIIPVDSGYMAFKANVGLMDTFSDATDSVASPATSS